MRKFSIVTLLIITRLQCPLAESGAGGRAAGRRTGHGILRQRQPLAGAATSIIFVATNTCFSRHNTSCRDSSMLLS